MMKLSLSFAALALAFAVSAKAEVENAQYEIKSMSVREVPAAEAQNTVFGAQVGIGAIDCSSVEPSPAPSTLGNPIESMNPIEALDTVDMIVDKIINIGQKIWKIVDAGKPVVNVRTNVATAMPQGARCWNDLQAWQVPQSKTYEVAFKNGFNANVVKMSYRVLWLPGGQAKGVGQYIGYATITPVNLEVMWGFKLNADVSIPTVFNMGSSENPIAGMQMNMAYQVESPIKTIQQGQAFFVDGRGNFQMLQ